MKRMDRLPSLARNGIHMPGYEEFVQLRDGSVRFFRLGNGPPLILLHGLGEGSIVWFSNITSLAESHTVYALDLPGHGETYKPVWHLPLTQGVQFLVEFMDAVDIDSTSVVGNSMGGLLALAATLQYPQRVDRLVLESSAGLGKEIAWFLRFMTLPLIGELMSRPSRVATRHLLHRIFYDPVFCTEELVDELYRVRTILGNKESMLFMLRNGVALRGVKSDVLLTDQLSLVDTKVLLLCGQNDLIFPVAHAEQACRAFPNARLEIFSKCGHWPHVEVCKQFNRIVKDFCFVN